jgi:RNA polymerase sigma-70 factor (ECF subfamily)
MKNEEDARDVAQETMLKGFLKLGTFQGRSKFSTWLTSITINEARNRLRHRSYLHRRSTGGLPESEGAEFVSLVPDTRENPSQFLERQELSYLLEQAVNGLSSDYRKVFELRVMQDMSTRETAELLKITNALVKARLHRARSSLQVSLRSSRKMAMPTDAPRWPEHILGTQKKGSP